MTAPDQTNAEVSDERLREIIAGCEGVQGGPWQLDAFACYVWAPSEKGGDFPLMDELGEKGRVAELRGWGYYTGNGHGALGLDPDEARRRQKLTGEHVARLDPATVKALATELLTRRSVSQASEGMVIGYVTVKPGARPETTLDLMVLTKLGPGRHSLYASPSKRVERLEAAEAALIWAMDEIDVLSNKLCQFGYPQGTSMLDRREQLDNYCKAVDARRQALQGGRS